MYHFSSEQISELRLADNILVTSHTTQYLKSFQIEALRFLYDQLSKQELCIYNDESGLGKSATIAALLSAIGPGKKTLIVLQNDDQLLVGWQFHFGVLTKLPVCVLQSVKDSTNSAHSVYLAKWSILRGIGDLSKLKFDYVIVDHRGATLNNNFCTSMLLKQFERKINIVISSLDITSDVKLLYNVLRMGGRLDHQYKNLKTFERKFYLPDAKEVFSKRMDLEEYYKQRGILSEYIKAYRLRRYRHQYDQCLPLVTPEQYKTNLSLWLASNNNSNSTLSGDTIASASDVRSTAGTDEIIECLMTIKMQRELKQPDESEKLSECSDDLMAMSPLVFDMSDSDTEHPAELALVEAVAAAPVQQTDFLIVSSDDCELVTPPTTPPAALTVREKAKKMHNAKTKDLTQLNTAQQEKHTNPKAVSVLPARKIRSCDNMTQASNKTKSFNIKLNRIQTRSPLKVSSPTQATEKATVPPTTANSDGEKKPVTRSSKGQKRELNYVPSGVHIRETRSMKRLTRSAEARLRNKYMTGDVALIIDKKPQKRKIKSETNQKHVIKEKEELISSPATPVNFQLETPRRGRKGITVKKETPKAKPNEKTAETPRTSKTWKEPSSQAVAKPTKGTATDTNAKLPNKKIQDKSTAISKPPVAPTSQLISSGSSNSEFAYMQCGQKLPDNLTQLDIMPPPAFRIPSTPHSTPFLLPATLDLCSEPDVVIEPPSHQHDIVVINSSQDESSGPSATATQSRRTRALKRKRTQMPKAAPSSNNERPSTSVSSFGQLLAQQRAQDKSPDIFSNCSQISHLTLTQPAPHGAASHFEGFKIFGSEVKQLQQQHANTPSTAKRKRGERSCLDILEQMFEPRAKAANNCNPNVLPTLPPNLTKTERKQQPQQKSANITQRRRTLIEDDIFEITNNGEFGSRMRLNSSGEVSPVQQPTQQRGTQHNKITNYLIGSSHTQEEEQQPTASSRNSLTLRKSPKGIKSTQSTKLTRWFATALPASGESVSAPSTPQNSTTCATQQTARNTRSAGPTKRKIYDIIFV